MKSRKISLSQLPKKYVGQLVALSHNRDKVLASAADSKGLIKKLREKKIKIDQVVLSGPIQEKGRTYVYRVSLSIQIYRRRKNS